MDNDTVNDIVKSRRLRKTKLTSEQNRRDHEMILERIKKNGVKMDFVSAYIDKIFGMHVTISPLLEFALHISHQFGLKVDRLAKRNRNALLCWFSENWETVFPHLHQIKPDKPFIYEGTSSHVSSPEKKSENNEKHVTKTDIDPSNLSHLLNWH
ncbi:hypothetical protein TVAG_203360 [Trichomonas vaginalis G3]|uniref:Uncharacterized protein n=1 Tax=Trichomonas vaginalis (strain ATCC PRA-98 / G3) TaxID=412133 RepID=A2FNH1_TRIV3|nr:hypothetical protein TVAGG3_0619360 [Trichomonas vaginalis G3]EAX93545.1 hypothetical protein TVAG_203360 [Trichomonas vaginalis G3]KAI5503781.1 hypothetical protein TVAGG3_0619360 [Trichomonas vaginalis G3]|eukprot:XP_001306475.1 hypothetical protein [Trichomonas vaginalis G3]